MCNGWLWPNLMGRASSSRVSLPCCGAPHAGQPMRSPRDIAISGRRRQQQPHPPLAPGALDHTSSTPQLDLDLDSSRGLHAGEQQPCMLARH